jgi:hypothetical protein
MRQKIQHGLNNKVAQAWCVDDAPRITVTEANAPTDNKRRIHVRPNEILTSDLEREVMRRNEHSIR